MTQFHIRRAARVLHEGGVVAYPTEAVYGLGCDPFNQLAFEKLLRLKARDSAKGVIVLGATFEQVAFMFGEMDESIQTRLSRTWPGPVTWIVPCHPRLPEWLRGGHGRRLAVRVSAHPVAAALAKAFGGPVVSTSANWSGTRPAQTALEVRQRFGNRVDMVLCGALGGARRPTEIRDALTGQVLRSGDRA